jgi:hypothetical protein
MQNTLHGWEEMHIKKQNSRNNTVDKIRGDNIKMHLKSR